MSRLCGQFHDSIHYIIVVGFQGLDSLVSRDGGLRHDELDVLGFQAGVIDWLAVVFFCLLLLFGRGSLLVVMVMVVVVIVTSVFVGFVFTRGELLGSSKLVSSSGVLDLSLTEDTVA